MEVNGYGFPASNSKRPKQSKWKVITIFIFGLNYPFITSKNNEVFFKHISLSFYVC